jgi:hypothetical protein
MLQFIDRIMSLPILAFLTKPNLARTLEILHNLLAEGRCPAASTEARGYVVVRWCRSPVDSKVDTRNVPGLEVVEKLTFEVNYLVILLL